MSDRLMESFRRLVRLAMARTDFHALYPAVAVTQNVDGTLELRADSPRVGSLSKVPIRLGLPDCSVKVANGARVLLGFEGGDPKRPVATLWDSATITELKLGASSATKRVAYAEDVEDALADLKAAIAETIVVAGDGGAAIVTSVTGLGSDWPPSLGSSTVKVK